MICIPATIKISSDSITVWAQMTGLSKHYKNKTGQLVKQNKQACKEKEQLENRLAFEDSPWQSEENKSKRIMRGGAGTLRMHAIELADGIIGDSVRLCGLTYPFEEPPCRLAGRRQTCSRRQ